MIDNLRASESTQAIPSIPTCTGSGSPLVATLTKELESLVQAKVRSGLYADASDVARDTLWRMQQEDDYESPALEAALLEGVSSPHRPYGKTTLARVRKSAAALKVSLPVSIAGRAEADLTHRYRWYLDHTGAEMAEQFLATFDDTVSRLAKQPKSRAASPGFMASRTSGRTGVVALWSR